MEALYSDQILQKKINLKYKEFRREKGKIANRDEEINRLYEYINDKELSKFALKFYINQIYPKKDRENSNETTESPEPQEESTKEKNGPLPTQKKDDDEDGMAMGFANMRISHQTSGQRAFSLGRQHP